MFSKIWNIVSDKIPSLKDHSFDNKSVRLVFTIIILTIALLFLLPSFLNNEALKKESAKIINQICNCDLKIYGELKVQILPTPAIIASDIFSPKIQNILMMFL
jgi:hypothetical protein